MEIEGDARVILIYADGARRWVELTFTSHPEGILTVKAEVPDEEIRSLVRAELRLPFYRSTQEVNVDGYTYEEIERSKVSIDWHIEMIRKP